MKKGFTSGELLIVLAIFAVLSGMSVPFLRSLLIRSELQTAAEQTNQLLRRAKILSQSGDSGSWGVYVPDGILYQGTSFTTRNESSDEILPLPSSVSVAGIQDVSFSSLDGIPSSFGIVTLEAINGDSIDIALSNTLGPLGKVSGEPDASFSIDFISIKNQGNGAAEPTVSVGPQGTLFLENDSIPLRINGIALTDTGFLLGVPGFAVQRTESFVRVLAYGDLSQPGGKEIVDARITFSNARILSIENDTGDLATENPFDGNVSNGVGGDEVTQEDAHNVFFQTRTTNYGDSILIYWEAEEWRK